MRDRGGNGGGPLAVGAALAFIAFFIWIVILADNPDGEPWWSFIGKVPHGDKVGHLGLVGTLSLLCNFAFSGRRAERGISRTTWVLFILLSAEELSQGFIPHRSLDVFDWLADLAGLAAGQTLARAIDGLRIRSRATKAP